jgi:hypothetical protein
VPLTTQRVHILDNLVNLAARRAVTSEDRYLDEIAEKARKKAEQIRLTTEDGMSLDDHLLSLKFWWSSFYKRPMKDPLLEEYSMYDLYLEFYLHTFSKEAVTSDMIADNKEELQDLFKDFENAPGQDFFAKEESSLGDAVEGEASWSMSEEDFQSP